MTFGPLAPPDKALELASALLLQRREEGWVITVYLNHHDLTTALSSFHLPDDRTPP